MKNKAFLDISRLTKEDFTEIDDLMKTLNTDFNQALWSYMHANPGKIKVLGEMKDGEIIRDEISKEGVKEYKGQEAFDRIINEVNKNKEQDET